MDKKALQQIEEEATKVGLAIISFKSKRGHNFGEIVLMIRGGMGLTVFPQYTLFCQYLKKYDSRLALRGEGMSANKYFKRLLKRSY